MNIKNGIQIDKPAFTIYLILFFFVCAIIWAKYASIDQLTRATGKVIPSSQVKHIQSLEGGLLKHLLVKEGQQVKQHQPLATIDESQFKSEYQQQLTHLLNLTANISRLAVESTDKRALHFPKVLNNHPKLIDEQKQLFKQRKQSLESKLKLLQDSYQFTLKELSITRPLVKKGIMSRLELLSQERRANDLKTKIFDEKQQFQQEALKLLHQKQSELRVVKEKLTYLKDRLYRTTIRSPVSGIVKQININTIGGVIKPGMDIMEIVPIDDSLLIEAQISPQDIAFIYPGLKAMIQVSAYDFTIYGGLTGKVVHVSADSQLNSDDQAYYEIWIRTDKNYLVKNNKRLNIMPGMIINAQIITGKRTLLSYLLKPILRARFHALGER